LIKLQVFSAAFLLGLFLAPVSAEAGRPLEIEKASEVNVAFQNDERFDKEIEVRAQNDGERIVIYATFLVPVGPQQAWAVLTDFDNIPNFISSVQFSKVLNRTGNNLRVSQRGTTTYGFITYAFDSVGEVKLSPFSKIQERMVSGSMRKMEEITVLVQEGHQTRINYHADIVPGHWIPKVPGQFLIENDARERFRQIKEEMIRRGKMLRSPANIR
jgi:carbon monoxide dehydrogenase subunit G